MLLLKIILMCCRLSMDPNTLGISSTDLISWCEQIRGGVLESKNIQFQLQLHIRLFYQQNLSGIIYPY